MTEDEYARILKGTTPFDGAEYLDDDELQAELLSDALASGDLDVITAALGIVARARGMTELAQENRPHAECSLCGAQGRRQSDARFCPKWSRRWGCN